jgi:thiamine pyrophosphate-dependent acetolactate synthase large subunit-like protein
MGRPARSPAAAREALLRATWMANTSPMGPVYINLDAEMQEAKLGEPLAPIDVARYRPPAAPSASPEQVKEAAAMLKAAKHPVMLVGRVSRSVDGWDARIALAEAINAKVVTDLKIGAGFPTDHPLHAGAPASNALVPEAIEALKAADLIWRSTASTSTASCAAPSASTCRRPRSSA